MTIDNIKIAAEILNKKHYGPEIDRNGEPTIDVNAPFTWLSEPVISAEDYRRIVIKAIVEGKPVNIDALTEWEKTQFQLWQNEALELIKLGAEPEDTDPEDSRAVWVDGKEYVIISLCEYDDEGGKGLKLAPTGMTWEMYKKRFAE